VIDKNGEFQQETPNEGLKYIWNRYFLKTTSALDGAIGT
jgi:hypothetical protein